MRRLSKQILKSDDPISQLNEKKENLIETDFLSLLAELERLKIENE